MQMTFVSSLVEVKEITFVVLTALKHYICSYTGYSTEHSAVQMRTADGVLWITWSRRTVFTVIKGPHVTFPKCHKSGTTSSTLTDK